ncbi:MAG: hypothetical protein LBO66_08895 [Deltaproteobacteria bacterium]|nr:hypothetical protein [Deltaproteobacteria bacterium]
MDWTFFDCIDSLVDGKLTKMMELFRDQKKTITRLAIKKIRLKKNAVLTLRATNMSVDEIGAALELSLTEVARIVERAAKTNAALAERGQSKSPEPGPAAESRLRPA